jgi:hypothetical protein
MEQEFIDGFEKTAVIGALSNLGGRVAKGVSGAAKATSSGVKGVGQGIKTNVKAVKRQVKDNYAAGRSGRRGIGFGEAKKQVQKQQAVKADLKASKAQRDAAKKGKSVKPQAKKSDVVTTTGKPAPLPDSKAVTPGLKDRVIAGAQKAAPYAVGATAGGAAVGGAMAAGGESQPQRQPVYAQRPTNNYNQAFMG